jgi:hypothetical protein
VRGRLILRSSHPGSRIAPAQTRTTRPYCYPRVGPAATIVCAMYGYSSSWMVERGLGPAAPLDGTAHDLEQLAGYRGVGPVRHPGVAPGAAVHESSLLLDVLERPNPAPPAGDGPTLPPLLLVAHLWSLHQGLCAASCAPPAADRRRGGTRGPQELSRLRPRGARAGASCPLPRRPREPRDPSRAVLGAQRCDPPTPFLRSFVRTDAQARVPVHGGGFSFLGCNLATGRPFLGVALRLPRLGRAPGGVPGGVLRNAKVRPDVQPLRVQRPGRPFLVPGSTLSPHQAPRRMLAKVGAAAGQAAPGRRHGPEEGAPFAPAVCSLPRRNGTVPFRAGTAPASPRP